MERTILIQQLDQLLMASKERIAFFASTFEPLKLEKDQQISCTKSEERSIYFLQDGLLHLYEIKPQKLHMKYNSRLTTLQLYLPRQFFNLPHSTQTTIQLSALKPSLLWTVKFQQLQHYLQHEPLLFEIVAVLQEQWQQQDHQRIAFLTTNPASRRYQMANDIYANDLYLIPQQLLAKHLGISRKHLARLNRQHLKRK